MTEQELPEQVFDLIQRRLGYTDDELQRFKANPRNRRVLETGMKMALKTVVFEVVESRGCNSEHVKGTRFFFSGDGNLITKMAPKRICAFLMPVMTQAMYGIHELWYAGVDPDTLHFKRGGCFDVGVDCGGWGNVVLEARVLDREEARKLCQGGAS